MNLEEAKKWYAEKKLSEAEAMRSPNNKAHWFLMARDKDKKVYLLVDADEKVIAYPTADELILVAKSIGFKTYLFHG